MDEELITLEVSVTGAGGGDAGARGALVQLIQKEPEGAHEWRKGVLQVLDDGTEAANVVLKRAGGAEGAVRLMDGGEGGAGGVHEVEKRALVAVGGEGGAGNGSLEEEAL